MKKILFASMLLLSASILHAKRIVSLLPSNTEILFALGAGNDIVGVSNFCDFPAEARNKEIAGDLMHPNIEKVLSLKPDIVIAGVWERSDTVARLRKLGLKAVEVPTPATVEEICGTVSKISQYAGREKEAEVLLKNMREKVSALRAKNILKKRIPTIYIEIDSPHWTVTSRSFVSDAVEICGAKNIFRDLKASAVQVSWEAVIEKDPDVILLIKDTQEEISERPGASTLSAVKNGRVIENFGNGTLNRPVPRIVLGMEELSKKLDSFNIQ